MLTNTARIGDNITESSGSLIMQVETVCLRDRNTTAFFGGSFFLGFSPCSKNACLRKTVAPDKSHNQHSSRSEVSHFIICHRYFEQLMDPYAIEMSEVSAGPRVRGESGHLDNGRQTLAVHDSTNTSRRESHKTLNTSLSSSLPLRQTASGYHLFADSSDKMSPTGISLPRWLVSCGKRTIDPNAEEYHVESWSNFHKKYSTHSHRATHNMKFSEIRKQQRREVTPSLTARILQRLGRRSYGCVNCRSKQCEGTCSVYSAAAKKQPSLPFRRKRN